MLADGYHNKLGSSNRATHYGNRIAYPAAYIAIGCSPNAQATYGCSDSLNNNRELGSTESVGADVHNFWSTSAVDADTGKPLARLALSVQLQDMMGQVMPAGQYSALFLASAVHAVHQPFVSLVGRNYARLPIR